MRKPLRLALTLALSLAGAARATDLTVDEIAARAAAARGGLEKIAAVQSLRLTARLAIGPDATAPLLVEMQRPGRIREELTLPGGLIVRTFDGKAGFQINPFAGAKDAQPLSANDARNLASEADFDGPLVGAKAKGMKVELEGHEKVRDRDAYRLKVTLANGDVQTYFYAADSFLEVKWIGGRKGDDGTVTVFESVFSDYREVAGLKFAFLVESGAQGSGQTQRLVFDKVEVDPKLDGSRFAKP